MIGERFKMWKMKSSIFFLIVVFMIDGVLGVGPTPPTSDHDMVLQESVVHHINSRPNALWKAAINPRFANHTVGQFKYMLGGLEPNKSKSYPVRTHDFSVELPPYFDARNQWPQCKSIGRVLDQGHCGSCWAFSTVEVLTDRFCIHHNKDVDLSVNDILACCGRFCGTGCEGGLPINAFKYLSNEGVVSEECDPYFDPYGCYHGYSCDPGWPTPHCRRKCKVKSESWSQSKRFSEDGYYLGHLDQFTIMKEIYLNGPVTARFICYDDLPYYRSGVYFNMWGGSQGGHIVKLIGWGTTDEGVDYWLAVNSWNRYWGEDGLFRIIRGRNECGIEENVVAGMPSLRNFP